MNAPLDPSHARPFSAEELARARAAAGDARLLETLEEQAGGDGWEVVARLAPTAGLPWAGIG